MAIWSRMNPRGMWFMFESIESASQPTRTRITFKEKSIIVDFPFNQLSQSWYDWTIKHEYIQVAFSYLNNDEREFLMTAITASEWNEIFSEEEY